MDPTSEDDEECDDDDDDDERDDDDDEEDVSERDHEPSPSVTTETGLHDFFPLNAEDERRWSEVTIPASDLHFQSNLFDWRSDFGQIEDLIYEFFEKPNGAVYRQWIRSKWPSSQPQASESFLRSVLRSDSTQAEAEEDNEEDEMELAEEDFANLFDDDDDGDEETESDEETTKQMAEKEAKMEKMESDWQKVHKKMAKSFGVRKDEQGRRMRRDIPDRHRKWAVEEHRKGTKFSVLQKMFWMRTNGLILNNRNQLLRWVNTTFVHGRSGSMRDRQQAADDDSSSAELAAWVLQLRKDGVPVSMAAAKRKYETLQVERGAEDTTREVWWWWRWKKGSSQPLRQRRKKQRNE